MQLLIVGAFMSTWPLCQCNGSSIKIFREVREDRRHGENGMQNFTDLLLVTYHSLLSHLAFTSQLTQCCQKDTMSYSILGKSLYGLNVCKCGH